MAVRTTDGDDKGTRVARGFSASETMQLSSFESLVCLGGITHSWPECALRLMNAAESETCASQLSNQLHKHAHAYPASQPFTRYLPLRRLRDRDISCPYPYYIFLSSSSDRPPSLCTGLSTMAPWNEYGMCTITHS